jgi:CHAT domain-containing protein
LGRDDEAEKYLQQSLKLQESLGDLDTPDLCEILNFTAEFHLQRGRLRDSLAASKRSSDIISSKIGRHHPLLAESLVWQARALRSLGQHDEAIALALESEQIAREHLRATMRVLSESHALGYAEDRIHGLDVALSTLAAQESGSRSETTWQMLIRSRAVVLDEITLRHQRLSEAGSTETDSLLIRFRSARERLSNLALRGPGWEDVESYHQLLKDARTEINDFDRQLALTDDRQRDQSVSESLVFDEIRSSLPDDTALVAYVRYLDEPSATGRTIVPTYRVFVLSSQTAEPLTIRIGTAAEIDPLVVSWQDHARLGFVERDAKSTRGILSVANDPVTSLAEYRDAGAELRQRIWDPIREHVGSAKRVLIVPDGTLHLVNMAALPIGSDRFLVDENIVFHTLNTERFLTASSHDSQGDGVLLVGSPAYGTPAEGSLGKETVLGTTNFQPLSYTGAEIDRVRRMWLEHAGSGVDVLEGVQATESDFKIKAKGHRVLHLATHGFFVPGGFGRLDTNQPLVYSGLALGGANQWRQSESGATDGLLTAAEVSSLDLCSVEWAVLSACETGLGSLEARGEGVFGLKRAFTLAGVRTVIMSLWKVDDESSLDWMTALYSSRLQDKLDTAESVRKASRTVLESRRAKGLSAHPYYWAGFTAAGDWR